MTYKDLDKQKAYARSLKRKAYMRAYDEARKDDRKTYHKEYNTIYNQTNAENIKNRAKAYFRSHHKDIRIRENTRYRSDLQYKLARILRSRLTKAIKRNNKTVSAVNDLGCTIAYFKSYLESLFEPWMTWQNQGRYNKNKKTWNIDHIIPLSSVNLEDQEQIKKVCHYTNVRPLEAIANIKKSNKIDW